MQIPIKTLLKIILLFQIINSQIIIDDDDCLDIPKTLCTSKGKKIISTLNKNPNLIGYYTFDESGLKDSSGHKNHLNGYINYGPSYFIKGNSGFFSGNDMLTIKHNKEDYKGSDITISFWIYLLEDSTDNWRTIIHKGENIQQLTPTIMLWPKERRLHIRSSTEIFWNEGIESIGIINMKQWTLITVIFSGQMVQLYINGNLDNQKILKGKIISNEGDFHIGKDPWHQGVKCYIDELKIYNTAIKSKVIEAEASILIPLIGSNYATLGCEKCTFLQALSSCPENYHMCSYPELYSGGYLIARRNGWFKFGSLVWARESQKEMEEGKEENEIGDPNVMKMCICCFDK